MLKKHLCVKQESIRKFPFQQVKASLRSSDLHWQYLKWSLKSGVPKMIYQQVNFLLESVDVLLVRHNQTFVSRSRRRDVHLTVYARLWRNDLI